MSRSTDGGTYALVIFLMRSPDAPRQTTGARAALAEIAKRIALANSTSTVAATDFLLALASGLAGKEIARSQHTSLSTDRTLIKSIFTQT